MEWKNVPIFISSTFNDMHAERDYLVKKVFPELSLWCEQRKLRLVEIDLRWGITAAESTSQNTVRACLRNIDECRPFFLCFLGQRRGWVPGAEDISEGTYGEYPDVAGRAGKSSVTEMEIEHALLAPMRRIAEEGEHHPDPTRHAAFLFRKDNFTDGLNEAQRRIYTNAGEADEQLADRQLAKLKADIRGQTGYVFEYEGVWNPAVKTHELLPEGEEAALGRLTDFFYPEGENRPPLSYLILSVLKQFIEEEYPGREPDEELGPLEHDFDQQQRIVDISAEGWVARPGEFAALDAYLENDSGGPCLLCAPVGAGKSSLLANWARKQQQAGRRAIARFCRRSELSGNLYGLLCTLWRGEVGEDAPPTLAHMRAQFPAFLERLAQSGPEQTILILDGVDELNKGAELFSWLPAILPPRLKIVLSVNADDDTGRGIIEGFRARGNAAIAGVRPFEERVDKQRLIDSYLRRYLKSFDDAQLDAICGLPASANPLYLRVLLSELRMFGSFRQIDEEILRFGDSPEAAFDAVLARLERDVPDVYFFPGAENPEQYLQDPRALVAFLFGLLAASRQGLTEFELTVCLTLRDKAMAHAVIPGDLIDYYFRQVRPFLPLLDGRYNMLDTSFRRAAQRRYAADMESLNQTLVTAMTEIADKNSNLLFEGEDDTQNAFSEMLYHLDRAGQGRLVGNALIVYHFLYNKLRLCGPQALIEDFELAEGEEYRALSAFFEQNAGALKNDAKQLPSRLLGAQLDDEVPGIRYVLAGAYTLVRHRWFKPIFPCFVERACYAGPLYHPSPMLSCATAEDDSFFAAGYADGSIRIWDRESGGCRATWQGHAGGVSCLALGGRGGALVSGGRDGAIRVWDVTSGRCTQQMEAHPGGVTALALADKGKLAASVGEDGFLRQWNLKNGKGTKAIQCPARPGGVDVSPDGRYAYVGIANGWMHFDLKRGNGEHGGRENLHGALVTYVKLAPSSGRLITVAEDGNMKMWDAESGAFLHTLWGHTGRVSAVKLCETDSGAMLVASSSMDGTFRFWDGHGGTCMATFAADAPLTALDFKGGFVAAGDAGGMGYLLALVPARNPKNGKPEDNMDI